MPAITQNIKQFLERGRSFTPQGQVAGRAYRIGKKLALGTGLIFGAVMAWLASLGAAALKGAMIGATVGGIAGGAAGGFIGFQIGVALAPFTFGLSIPFFTLLGATTGAFVGATIGAITGGLIGLGMASGSATAITTGVGAGIGGTVGAIAGYSAGATVGTLIVAGCAAITGGACALLAPIIPVMGGIGGIIGGYLGTIAGGLIGYAFGHYVVGTIGAQATGALAGATIGGAAGFAIGGPVGTVVGAGVGATAGWLTTGGYSQVKEFFSSAGGAGAGGVGGFFGAIGGALGAVGSFITLAAASTWNFITSAAGTVGGWFSGAVGATGGGATGVFGAIGSGISNAAGTVASGVTGAAGTVGGSISGAASGLLGAVGNLSIPTSVTSIPIAAGLGTITIGSTLVGITTASSFFDPKRELAQPIPVLVGDNDVFRISKTVSPTALDNSALSSSPTITFTITLEAKDRKLLNITITDNLTVNTGSGTITVSRDVNNNPISPPCGGPPGSSLSANGTWICQIRVRTQPNWADSLVNNAVTVTARAEGDPEATQGNTVAALPIGNAPQVAAGCPHGWPTTGTISQGPLGTGSHTTPLPYGNNAIDILTGVGTPVYATATGTILYTDSSLGPLNQELAITLAQPCVNSAGILAELYYFHMSELHVSSGQSVTWGQLIGRTGASPNGVRHLHYQFGASNTPRYFTLEPPYIPEALNSLDCYDIYPPGCGVTITSAP